MSGLPRKHAHTHHPTRGTDPLEITDNAPLPWVRVMCSESDPRTIPDGAGGTQINFDAALIVGSDDYTTYFDVDLVVGGGDDGRISTVKPKTFGFYLFTCEAKWDNLFPEPHMLGLFSSNIAGWSYTKEFPASPVQSTGLPGTHAFSFFEQWDRADGWRINATHDNATDQDINGIYFQVTYFGIFTGISPGSFNFQQ